MKKQLLFFLLLIAGIGNAQIVDIPDAAFKNLLIPIPPDGLGYYPAKDEEGNAMVIDSNGDGEIQVSEAEAVWELKIQNDYDIISTAGIEAFVNLRSLTFIECQYLSDVDLTALTNLEYLKFEATSSYADPYNINIEGLINLKELYVRSALYDTFNTGTFNANGVTGLEKLILDSTEVFFDVTQLTSLKYLIISDNFNAPPEVIDLTNLSNLETCAIMNISSEVVFGEKPNLTYLNINDNNYSAIDLSGCTALTTLTVYYHPSDTPRFLNLKNGISSYETLFLNFYSNTDSPLYICIDEGNENLLPEPNANNTQMFVSTYCDFIPGGNYNTITGNFTFDADNNGCDESDFLTKNFRVDIATESEEEFAVFSNNLGEYNFYWSEGTFTLAPSIENSDWFTITPSTATVTFEDDNNNIESQNFCVTANGEHPDVEVVIAPIVPAQPGFDAVYKITYRNKGNQTLSGSVSMTYDNTILDYVSSTSGVADTGDAFIWNYSDLQPFETRIVNLTLNVNSPAENPAVNIDDILNFTATVTPITGDENEGDNTFTLNQTVIGSYDPNDITCLEGETVHMSRIGEYLHYNVNFENTGTAPATFVVVKDAINEEQFDVSTLQLMYASHNVQTKIEGNQVEFYFGDINLAADGGKGNVVFKIKTLETLEAEDVVTQQANIFFDYNLPIVTNEANTIFATLNNTVFAKDSTVKLYPNPTADNVTISAKGMVKSVELYDVQGRLLQVNAINDTQAIINLSSQPSGLYFVKVITEEGSVVEKLIKQ
ncbi:hypothetical protein GCM10007424_09040 [Flavobacterium suaedae]|uniref:T9SS type A sorting domain-containing protein n=1 Tax=Flavobacterium suaedae TaxID=1767027 RepID=A0ABQ1JKB9_9FLAO|nr:T9SS type A sorting domain-containing protein [Flavobacterium suaedae]GGB71212.1 hypothetical protein GCM10007424_09040 [Flavobacterium suaedae]